MDADRLGKGWNYTDLAAEAGVSLPTVTRFFSGEHQSPSTAKKLALALGHPAVRYLRGAEKAVA